MRRNRNAISGLPYAPRISGVPAFRPSTNAFGGERMSGISITPHRHPSTGAFGCTVGLAPFLGVVAYGKEPADAVHTAASVASDVSAMLDEHPLLNAVLPPGTSTALKGVALASQALKQGYTLKDVAKNVGPGTARVLSDIMKLF